MRILLIEPYFRGSHQAWAEGYQASSAHSVDLLTLPGQYWTWRMRGGALTLARMVEDWVSENGLPDLVLTTDMVDVAAFRGFTAGFLRGTPIAVFFHETQFTYPWSPQQRPDLQYAYVNWSSLYVADLAVFNSQFHRDVVFEAVPKFLRGFPDFTHESLVEKVVERVRVMPVGVDLKRLDQVSKTRSEPPLIVWNQRWEHDKDPETLFQALFRLAGDGTPFRLAICGENTGRVPEEFLEARRTLGDRIHQFGFAPEVEYLRLLRDADIVVSTALHEFFGIAVVEAAYAGAFPVLPNRLSYPELMPVEVHPDVLYEEGDLDRRLRWAIEHPQERSSVASVVANHLARYDWSRVAPRFDHMLAAI